MNPNLEENYLNNEVEKNVIELPRQKDNDMQQGVPSIEEQKQEILKKIKIARERLKAADEALEETSKVVSIANPEQQRHINRRLEDLEIMLRHSDYMLRQKEQEGQYVDPEERRLEVLRGAVQFENEELRKEMRKPHTPAENYQYARQINHNEEDINNINSHIRK